MRLLVFLTAGVSLRQWEGQGTLDRELSLYRQMRALGHEVAFVSYGGREDWDIARRLRGEFRFARNVFNLPRHLYVKFLPLLHARALRRADVVKCNQADGGEVALRAARFHGKPMVARSGYPWAKTLAEKLPPGAWEIEYARRVERELAAGCRRWLVTTPAAAEELRAAHPAHADKVRVVPNAVDTDAFQPRTGERDVDALWIGRLEEEKRPLLFLQALRPGQRAVVIGQGSQLEPLRAHARERGLSVEFTGALPHAEIAAWMNRARLYVITSRYEGHPKSLLEAMSCGLPCLGVDVRGIREQLRTGDTGWLCGDAPDELGRALAHLLSDPTLRERLGAAARREILSHYSLRSVVELELAALAEAATSP